MQSFLLKAENNLPSQVEYNIVSGNYEDDRQVGGKFIARKG